MFGFKCSNSIDSVPYEPVSLSAEEEELKKRINSLSDEERHIYKWLKEYYSERWIAETLFMTRAQLRERIRVLCRKLGVPNVRAMLRIYGQLDPPSERNRMVCTEEIDAYVDARTEREIQRELRKMKER